MLNAWNMQSHQMQSLPAGELKLFSTGENKCAWHFQSIRTISFDGDDVRTTLNLKKNTISIIRVVLARERPRSRPFVSLDKGLRPPSRPSWPPSILSWASSTWQPPSKLFATRNNKNQQLCVSTFKRRTIGEWPRLINTWDCHLPVG